jgi:hypothetical protein
MSAPTGMRWRVESWDPSYGASSEDPAELSRSTAQLDLDVELPASSWRPIGPHAAGNDSWSAVLFVDGVRRIDAMAWISDEDQGQDGGTASMALCASYAAGVVRCQPGAAQLVAAEVRRGLFSTAGHATDVLTSAGRYQRVQLTGRGEPVADLSLAVQRALGDVEASVAAAARGGEQTDRDLLVVDGPLRGRQHLPRVLGFVKTHRSEYLPDPLVGVVAELRANQRTPVFRAGSRFEVYTWYLRLPCAPGAPWAGVVRVECSAELPAAEAAALAATSQVTLGRFASAEYKDSRAPQNLYPIAGLERQLRRRLGEPGVLYRALRRAAASSGATTAVA